MVIVGEVRREEEPEDSVVAGVRLEVEVDSAVVVGVLREEGVGSAVAAEEVHPEVVVSHLGVGGTERLHLEVITLLRNLGTYGVRNLMRAWRLCPFYLRFPCIGWVDHILTNSHVGHNEKS